MKLLYFDIFVSLVFLLAMAYLFREYWAASPEERYQRQTVPMMLAVTILYVCVIWKTHALAALFAGG